MKCLESIMEWKAYQCQDGWCHLFQNIILKRDMGRFPVGTKFYSALFDARLMNLEFADNDSPYTSECGLHKFSVIEFQFGSEKDYRNNEV